MERIPWSRKLFKTEGLQWRFCHCDAFLDNTLFDNTENCKMLALFDWEDSAVAPRALDLAVGVVPADRVDSARGGLVFVTNHVQQIHRMIQSQAAVVQRLIGFRERVLPAHAISTRVGHHYIFEH